MNLRRLGVLLCLLSLLGAVGCAPKSFGRGETYYADQYHVRDAAARHVKGVWHLRFNALSMSDLDDAIAAGKAGRFDAMRRTGKDVLREATNLAQASAEGEIYRLPPEGQQRLAALAECDDSPAAITAEYKRRSEASLDALLGRISEMPDQQALSTLTTIRNHIEPAVDDKGRLGRQIALGFGALPAWMGVKQVEAETEQQHRELQAVVFDRTVVCKPQMNEDDEFARYAPVLVMEWPEDRDYPARYDRFGEVFLTGSPDKIEVNVNTDKPVIYTYKSEAKIHGERYTQLCYSWWYPKRPAMSENDPEAGNVDGDTLRITLDHDGRPAVFEIMQSCGCGHLVYVSSHVEELARRQFGHPVEGKSLHVEKAVQDNRDVYVMGIRDVPKQDAHPVVYAMAGYHSIQNVDCIQGLDAPANNVTDSCTFTMMPYDTLDRLPLGDGVASMFGPDGLVHNAGRSEGYLLAPTGMLSAGQPRKRGTQKIRWDAYNFEDPLLLEKTLRLPDPL